jgi:hypothetical protein
MRGQATLTKDEAEKLVQAACSAMSAELARLRAELEQTDKLRLQAQQSRDTWQTNYYKMREEMRVISGISSKQDTPIEYIRLIHKIASYALK